MGNHYDPRDESSCAYTERGERTKLKIAAMPSYEIGIELFEINKLLKEIESAVLGGEAIDTLRLARKKLMDIT